MSSNLTVRTGSIEDLLVRVLDRGYTGVAGRVLSAVAGSVTGGQVQRDIDAMMQEADRLAQNGERLRVDNPHVRAVLNSVELAMRDNVVRIRDASGDIQLSGVTAGNILSRQLALPGFSDEALQAVGITWNQVSPETVMRLIELVDNPAFAAELSSLSANVIETIRNQAIRGVVFGWSPARTAREIARIAQTLPQVSANTLMRTLQLESYRTTTTANQNANQSIIRRVIRIETLDERICAACIALHGTVVWDATLNEGQPIPKIREHHNGRGTTITETVIRPVTIRSGVDWFDGLDDARQRRLIGHAAVNARNAGAVRLEDFVGERTDDLFGEQIYEQSVVGILGDGAGQYYERNQGR